jgi:hypothetical protein
MFVCFANVGEMFFSLLLVGSIVHIVTYKVYWASWQPFTSWPQPPIVRGITSKPTKGMHFKHLYTLQNYKKSVLG